MMGIRLRLPAWLLVMAVVLPIAAGAATTDERIADVLGDSRSYRLAVEALQAAVRTHDAAGFAALVRYPITVTIDGRRQRIGDAGEFRRHYDQVVTPAIAAAIADQRYEDLFVNEQGVMFGDGEVWLSGICRDRACQSADVKLVTIQPGPEAAATGISAGPMYRSFKDWVVGCDNRRTCTALGLEPEGGEGNAYVKVTRGGAASDAAEILLAIYSPEATPTALLRLSSAGEPLAGAGAPVAPSRVGDFVVATLSRDIARDVLEAVRTAASVDIDVMDGAVVSGSETVSLAGSAAALRFMDEAQGRTGTPTALVHPGGGPTSAIAPVPAAPKLTRQPIAALPDPLPPLPAGIPAATDESCTDVLNLAYRLAPEVTLWGVCANSGAYSVAVRFYLVDLEQVQPVRFAVPLHEPRGEALILTNPNLDSDGRTLRAYARFEGIGDCGEVTEWIWDGRALQLASLARLDPCRGVPPYDWPVLFTADAD